MITLNGKTKLTTQAEKLFVKLGGENPNKTLTRDELATALVNAVNVLAAQNRTRVLEKMYLAYRRDHPSLPSLDQVRSDCQKEDEQHGR